MLLVLFGFFLLPAASGEENVYVIGILSHRGPDHSLSTLAGTAEYLSEEVPNCTFEILPLDYDEIFDAVSNDRVDFVLTDPFLYVELESTYGISRIATMKNSWGGNAYTEYGGVIITRSDNDNINELSDLRGKSLMAVDEHSFGGFWIGVRTMEHNDIDYREDFSNITFGKTHDAVVYAVRSGSVDVGIIRTDVLERLAAEGKINISEFKVINQQHAEAFPFLLSTQLYPEWAFSKVSSTPLELAEEVTIALLSMPSDTPSPANESNSTLRSGNYAGWTIPLDYTPVHELMKELRLGPYENYGRVPLNEAIAQHWYWVVLFFMLLVIIVTYDRLTTEKIKKDELEKSNKLKDLFTDIMRHDLLNPAGTIKGFNDVLYLKEDDEEKRKIIEAINRQTDKLISMIDSAAKLAKLESSHELELDKRDLGVILKNVAESLDHGLREKDIRLELAIPGKYPSRVNEIIEEVFTNLMSNAIKYSPEGSKVKVEIIDAGSYWKVHVIDSGDGVADENKSRIFERFTRADRKGIKGSGLGLAIVKRIIELHNGFVGVNDNPEGKGSVFWVALKKYDHTSSHN
nr:sensor histidine kinase [Methanolobus chelungpuianus]